MLKDIEEASGKQYFIPSRLVLCVLSFVLMIQLREQQDRY